MKISDFFEVNYRVKRLRSRSQNTLRLYRSSIRNFEKTLGRTATLDDFTDENIGLVMQTMLDRGCSPYTANKERSQLLAMWRFAHQQLLVKAWPTIMAEKEPERVPQAWLAVDVHQLMDAVGKLTGSVGAAPAALWWRSLLSVCLDTGERIGAVSQAKWAWLDRDWILIPAEARKGGRRDRRYQLNTLTLELLAELRACTTLHHAGALMFAWPYHPTYLWTRYTRILEMAGLPHGPKDKFHRLRKTLGSVAYAAGLDAQDILDHQSRKTTKKYLDPRFSRDVQPAHVLAQWLRNPKPTSPLRKHG